MMKSKLLQLAAVSLILVNVLPTFPAAAMAWETGISSASVSTVAAYSPEPPAAVKSFQDETLRIINRDRAGYGLAALKADETLNAMADIRAKEASVLFSHTRPNGESVASLFEQYKLFYLSAGENLASGYRTPAELAAAWMNSPEHRRNILNANFSDTGIGFYQNPDGTIYCAQLFEQP